MGSCGAKAPSLVVAASMGAVEALKDQAGLCRWDYALRSAAAPTIRALSASLSKAKPASRQPPPAAATEVVDLRLRKAHHLLCWGPN